MLQMVACERGVAALPRWLVAEYQATMDVVPVRLGRHGIAKQIFLGRAHGRRSGIDFIADFIRLAGTKGTNTNQKQKRSAPKRPRPSAP